MKRQLLIQRVVGVCDCTMRALLALLACTWLAWPALAADTAPASDLLARHRKALGGDKGLETASSWTAEGSVSLGSESRTFRWTVVAPSLFREDIRDGSGLEETVATDGQNAWMTSVNGDSAGLQGCASTVVRFVGPLLARGYLDPADLGWDIGEPSEAPSGQWSLPVALPGGVAAALHFGDKKALLSRAEVNGDGCRFSVAFEDYRKHGKTRFPHRVLLSLPWHDEDSPATYLVTTVKTGVEVSPEAFERPSPVSKGFRFDDGTDQVDLPLSRDAAGRVLVQFQVAGGEAGWWVLDTQARQSEISASLLEVLKLDGAGTWHWMCPGGSRTLFRLPALRAGNLEIGPILVGAGDSPGATDPVAGTLGTDILQHLVVVLRFGDGRIAFHDPDRYVDTGGGDALPMDAFDRIIVLLNGRAVAPMAVATALTDPPILLTGPIVEANRLEPEPARRVPLEIGSVLNDSDYVALLESIQVGGTAMAGVPARFRRQAKPLVCAEQPSLLGLPLLERFDIVLDFPHRQIIIDPTGRLDTPFPVDRSGLAPVYDEAGGLVATRDARGGKIRKGDRLIAVRTGKQWSEQPQKIARALQGTAGTVVILRIERGKSILVRKLTLADP